MDIRKQSQHLSPAQQYHVLRMQIPVIEFADSTTDELVEPYPANGKKWIKTSKMALVITGILAAATVSLSFLAHQMLSAADREIRLGHYNNQKAIMEAVRQTREMAARGIPTYSSTESDREPRGPRAAELPAMVVRSGRHHHVRLHAPAQQGPLGHAHQPG